MANQMAKSLAHFFGNGVYNEFMVGASTSTNVFLSSEVPYTGTIQGIWDNKVQHGIATHGSDIPSLVTFLHFRKTTPPCMGWPGLGVPCIMVFLGFLV